MPLCQTNKSFVLYQNADRFYLSDLQVFRSNTHAITLDKSYGLVVEVDANGNYRRSLHDPTGNIAGISHAEEHEGKLFMASLFNNFIAMVYLDIN